MKEKLFEDLIESVREGGGILRGDREPSRRFRIQEPDVAAVRDRYGLSQAEFAAMLGISVRTLQNWEQGRRRPHGPARVLLRVAAEHPEAVLDVVKKAS
jgi:putative transcriptional regulator